MSTTRRKGATPQKAHKVEVSFTNWVMGGSLLSLSTTSSLGSRVSSKGNHKNFDVDADDEEPPDPAPPAPAKLPKKKKEVPPAESKKAEEVKVVCDDCQPEPEKPVGKCAPECPVCNEDCAWEKHMHEKYGGIECDTCGRGANWLMDEFHKGRGEYACERCTPDCAACGRGPLWLSKKWEKTLKRRARKLQGMEKDKKDKKDDGGKKDKEDGGAKGGKSDDGEKAKDKGKEKTQNKEKEKQKGKESGGNKDDEMEKDKAEAKSAEKEKEPTSKEDVAQKKNQGGKGKNTHEWTSEEDAKLKDLKSQNKSWKDIASDMGIDAGLCKTRYKNLEHSGDAATEKKDENSSGDKQGAGGGDGDRILGGFSDWNNDNSNNSEGNSSNTDNQGWGAPDNSNANGETSGAGINGWGTNDNSNSNSNANANAEGSSWENNNSSTNAETSGGDNGNSSWENNNNTAPGDAGGSGWDSNNNNTNADAGNQGWGDAGNSSWDNNNNTTGDSGNQGWGDTTTSGWSNDDSNKTSNDSGGNKDNQQSQSKNNGGGKKQKDKNKDNNQDKQNEIFAPIAPITESNPTGYIPYKSANNAAVGTSAWDTGANTSFPDATAAQSSGGLPETGTADISGSGWGAPNTEWDNNNPSNGNTGNEPGRDPWAQTEGQNDSGNGGASTSGNNPSNPAPADNGWFTVTESALDIPINNNTGPSWSQLPSGGGTDAWNKPENASQHRGSSKGQASYSNNNNATSWNHPNNTYQASGYGGNLCGQGNSLNNGGDCSFGPNVWNNSNPNSFNSGNNGGFNSNNNSNGFSQGNRSRGRLRPNGAWSQEDCLKLEFLYSKNHEYMWKQIQADFYNWTRRFVPSELIEQKFREDGYA
ncbi:hypothetical protein IFR04_001606 [Cadophora malorum]|uniref:Myb-like domain-containing protein n=1 Tax=Cadophora malorum TaxID=108018 RepID=A0A8H7WI80_9HELO|nr:hypothetical protein IFR04_001606 [Cadophora malorum]